MDDVARVLLHRTDDLCDAFYHIKPTPEANVTQRCLCVSGCCSGKTTCLIAQLVAPDGGEHFLQLYRNAAQTSCAEGFLQRDEALLACVEKLHAASGGGATLNLYLTQQPCHYSSSNEENSCTDNLLRWWKRWMQPRGVERLVIKAAYPYRTHWDEHHMSEDDLAGLGRRKWGGKGGRGHRGGGGGGRTADRWEAIARARRMLASAREGTRILVGQPSDNVTLEAFSERDWQFVLGCCNPSIRAQYETSAAPFTPEVKGVRAALDAFTKNTFDLYRPGWAQASGKRKAAEPPPPPRAEEQTGCSPAVLAAASTSRSGAEDTRSGDATKEDAAPTIVSRGSTLTTADSDILGGKPEGMPFS